MATQVAAFQRIQVHCHGSPRLVYGDEEYKNTDFINFCKRISFEFVALAANNHREMELFEGTNRILKSYFYRVRSEDHRSSVAEILAEATFGKIYAWATNGRPHSSFRTAVAQI